MAISDLKAKQGKVDIIVEVVEISDAREFSKFGSGGRVANAIVKDESGSMKLTLWNEQIDMVHEGDKIHIKNGYVSDWKDELQLSTGKFGTLEIVEKGAREEVKPADPEADYNDEELEGPEIEEEEIQ